MTYKSIPPVPPTNTKPIELACGIRRTGKLYVVTTNLKEKVDALGLAPFVMDPPIFVNSLADWGLSVQGVGFWTDPQSGITHLTRYYGADNYPEPSDPIEETINVLGSSLIPDTADPKKLAMLEPGVSKILVFHPYGYYLNTDGIKELKRQRKEIRHIPECFLDESMTRESHVDPNSPDMCSALWWQAGTTRDKKDDREIYERYIGGMRYKIASKPVGLELEPAIALIAAFPLDHFHIPVGDGSHGKEEVMTKKEMLEDIKTRIPFILTRS